MKELIIYFYVGITPTIVVDKNENSVCYIKLKDSEGKIIEYNEEFLYNQYSIGDTIKSPIVYNKITDKNLKIE